MMTYMAQPRHLWNNQVLSKFFPSAEYTNEFSRQYSKWSFSMYFMTSTLFSSFPPPVLSPLSATQSIQSATQSPSLVTTPLPFFSHSPYFSSLYPKPAPDNRSKYDSWITSLIHLFFHHLHPCLSTTQSILLTKQMATMLTNNLSPSLDHSINEGCIKTQWVRESRKGWLFFYLSLLSQNVNRNKRAHCLLISQTHKTGISKVAAAEDNTCVHNRKSNSTAFCTLFTDLDTDSGHCYLGFGTYFLGRVVSISSIERH